MVCAVNHIDSSVTALAYAEEECPKILPGVLEVGGIWRNLEPNSYSDFGGALESMARDPINASRQRQRGTVTNLTASAGFVQDFTQTNMQRLLQGFVFADAHEKGKTQPLNGTQIPITSTTAANYVAAGGMTVFPAGALVKASGFTTPANNGFKRVTGSTATTATVTPALTVEAAPPAAASLSVVGHQFAAGDVSMTVTAVPVTLQVSEIALNSAASAFGTLGLNVGEWICIGGDVVGSQLPLVTAGYARIVSIAPGKITLAEPTFVPLTDAGAGASVQMFFGTFLRNEKVPALIKKRTYQLERQLGDDGGGIQSEYVIGATPNTLKLSVPVADKVTVDLAFVGLDVKTRTGLVGIKPGTRITTAAEPALNTSSDVVRMRLAVSDPAAVLAAGGVNPLPLVGFLTSLDLDINNGVAPIQAIGVLGGFGTSVGQFVVEGGMEAYFTDVRAVAAARANSDLSMNAIFAQDNAGVVFDLPLVTVAGAQLKVEKDRPIMIPLTGSAFENSAGYTLGITFFDYLPTLAMPV